jgi:long-subunit acyl-CoA synthetase (AMP-forming)
MNVINTVAANGGKSATHRITFFQKGRQNSLTLAQLDALAARLAGRLRDAGFERGDRIGVLARNGIEWIVLDLAAIKAGLVTAGFEFGKFKDPAELIGNYALKGLYSDVAFELPADRPAVLDVKPLVAEVMASDPVPEDCGGTMESVRYEPGDCTTIKFTSGSTGEPKGLCATVGSIDASLADVQTLYDHGGSDNILVFLPLSLLQQRYWVYSALTFGHDVTVTSFEFALDSASKVQPTVIMGVPGFYESIKKHLERGGALASGDADLRRDKLQGLLGKRIRYLWTGSAPAGPDMLNFFQDGGMPIFEGYGMNETCIVSKNYPGHHKPGSVGRLLPNKRARIDGEGVLIVGGDHPVNTAYAYCQPGDSEKIFLPGGEVRTGDLARFDEEGYLYILGRADDLVVLANGKNVYVRKIEEQVRQHPAVDECVLFGSGEAFLVAVISPREAGLDQGTLDAIGVHVETVNAALPRDEWIVKTIVAPEPFTIDGGLLTSQYKPKRKEIFKKYNQEIAKLYGVKA